MNQNDWLFTCCDSPSTWSTGDTCNGLGSKMDENCEYKGIYFAMVSLLWVGCCWNNWSGCQPV